MAYTKSTITEALRFFSNRRYPKKLSRRESRLYQSAVDTVLNDAITVSAAYTPTDEIKIIIVDTSATITLPASASNQGRTLTVICSGAVTATIAASGGDSFDAVTLDADEENATFLCVGTNWVLINSNVA